MSKKVLIGMSGGVDSSVAAYLLQQQGYDVIGVTMRLCEGFGGDLSHDSTMMARKIAKKLGIEFIALDYRDEFRDYVMNPFVGTYERGATPNPCIECNRCIKFDLLVDDSDEGYYDDEPPKIATGHYAVVETPKHNGDRWKLRKSANTAKDQSYFLYTLTQDTLSRVIFPIGGMDKDEVRRIAESQGFINAGQKDSQDICFVPDGDYAGFIKRYSTKEYPEGDFVDKAGNVLGRHRGIINYTLGQRKGLGLALKEPMYVVKLDVGKNQVVLGNNEELFTRELTAGNFNWVSIAKPSNSSMNSNEDRTYSGLMQIENNSFRALGRIRYKHQEAPCTVYVNPDSSVSVVFDEPQRAITAGQSLVLYDIESDQYVLGGGIIMCEE